MLTKQEIWTITKAQLAQDLGCKTARFEVLENQVLEWRYHPLRRTYWAGAPFFEVAVINGVLIAACNKALLPWARKNLLPRQAEWLFSARSLRELEDGLTPFGYKVGNAQQIYLPDLTFPRATPRSLVRWYEGESIKCLSTDGAWKEALAANEFTPDVLAVGALDHRGELMALAGASRDGMRMWQIGIQVLPAHQGEGLGANLTALLKDELLRREIVPFYTTASSHILAQNVALNAGFRPAFGYLYARRQL